MNPLVSIIIPAYNCEKLISDTINSILEQTYSNFELIIIDDGSKDQTKKVVNTFTDKRIKYVYQKNSGIPAAPRNKGVKLAKGKYIAFIDHDDLWLPDKLMQQMNVVKNNPKIGLISTNAYFLYNNITTKKTLFPTNHNYYFTNKTFFPENKIIQSSTFLKKDVFLDVGGLNESMSLKAIEDYDLWIRIYAKYPCYYLSEPLIYYRVLKNSTSGNRVQEEKRRLDYFEKHFHNYNFSDLIYKKVLFHSLFKLGLNELLYRDINWKSHFRKTFVIKKNIFSFCLLIFSILPLDYLMKFKLFQLILKLKK